MTTFYCITDDNIINELKTATHDDRLLEDQSFCYSGLRTAEQICSYFNLDYEHPDAFKERLILGSVEICATEKDELDDGDVIFLILENGNMYVDFCC